MSNRPLRTRLRRVESLASFVSRSAGLHGAPNAATFASWFGANFRELCRGTDHDLDKMADILGCEPKEMKKRVILGKRSTRRFCDMELPKSFVRQSHNRVCPLCILCDEKSGDGRMIVRPFARLTWAFEHHDVCPKHCKRLVSLPSLPWELGDDFHFRLRAAKNLPDLGWEGEYEEPSAIDRYIVARFEGEDHPATWLDDLPLPAALRLCEAIGHEHEHDRDYRFKTAKAPPSNGRINDGFNRIAASEDKFRLELQDVISRNYPRRTFTAFTVFADLTAELVDDLYRPEFSKAADIMRGVAYQILPLGPSDELFGPAPHRRFHAVKTAARNFEIPVHSKRYHKSLEKGRSE